MALASTYQSAKPRLRYMGPLREWSCQVIGGGIWRHMGWGRTPREAYDNCMRSKYEHDMAVRASELARQRTESWTRRLTN